MIKMGTWGNFSPGKKLVNCLINRSQKSMTDCNILVTGKRNIILRLVPIAACSEVQVIYILDILDRNILLQGMILERPTWLSGSHTQGPL